MDPSTITDWTFLLTERQTGVAVDGVVSYYNSAKTATFAPKRHLYHLDEYTAIIVGGPAGVRAFNGNRMSQSHSWTFKTGTLVSSGVTTLVDTSGRIRPLPPSQYIQVQGTYPEDFSSNLARDLPSVNIEFNTRPVSGDISKFITVETLPAV
tara:strand:- start:943 stop:1398 length:456 start_codon:yes stop_codon:yes gene_type:complete